MPSSLADPACEGSPSITTRLPTARPRSLSTGARLIPWLRRGGSGGTMVPEEVEAIVRRVADIEGLARTPSGSMRLVALPDLRRRALETDHVLRLRRTDP